MSDDVSVAEAAASMLLRLYDTVPQFDRIRVIGNERGLNLADSNSVDSSIGSQNPGECKLAIVLSYHPNRDDGQPCLVMIVRIIYMILTVVFLCSAEYATLFLSNNVVILNRCPYGLDYLHVQANRAWYEALLAETDGPMKEVISRVLLMFPQLGAVLALGDSAYEFVSSMVSAGQLSESNVPQEESSPHPQIHENKFTTLTQLRTTMADFIAALEKATGLVAVGVPTKDDLNKIFTVSKVTPEERSRRSAETRALNRIIDRIATPRMKEEILRLAPSDDEVREKIDTMSLRELGLWIHQNGKRLEKEAAAAAAKKHKAEAKAAVAQMKKDAMKEAAAAAVAAAKKQARENQIQNDEVVVGMMVRKRKG